MLLAGDFNPGSRTEACLTTFKTYLSDSPIPVDNLGNSFTSINRNDPHDYVLPSFSMTNLMTATVFPSHSFPTGLVFDSRVYTPLSDVPPILSGDSSNAQHMAVMKDFSIPYLVTNYINNPAVPRPLLVLQSANVISWEGVSNVTYSVSASSDLTTANWRLLGTASSTNTHFSFTNASIGTAAQFYRVTQP